MNRRDIESQGQVHRPERVNQGTCPYDPRYADISYSCNGNNDSQMRIIYQKEWHHFIEAITSNSTDVRLQIPEDLKEDTMMMFSNE